MRKQPRSFTPGLEQIRSGMTRRYAVLGSPIDHSKSPIIHQAAFAALGVDAEYSRVELASGLAEWVANLGSDWSGLSLTMPLKELALALATRADSLAISTGAANTLIREDGGWDAYNTDVFGIQRAVAGLRFKSVAVIGSGATARSAIVAMQEMDKDIQIWARNAPAVKSLCAEFGITPVDRFYKAANAELVISTLPSRALDSYLEEIRGTPTSTLLDVAYDPWPSKAAEAWGLNKVISGIEMLIWQAVGQQRLFAGNGLEEPLENEKELVLAIRKALEMAK